MGTEKVIVFPKQSKFNIAVIILMTVFIYMLVCVYSFLSKEQIVGYEVREGSLMEDNRYKAVILRDEQVITGEKNGYVSYFVSEGERIGTGNLVYTLDETGTVLEYTENLDSGENALSNTEQLNFKHSLDEFVQHFDKKDMHSLYQMETTVRNQTQKLANQKLLDSLKNVSSLSGLVKYHYASDAGNVAYWVDGLETLTPFEVSNSLFEDEEYSVDYLTGNRLIGAGEPVYKLYNNEHWSIAFPVSDRSLAERYLEEEVLMVRFLKNDISFWGNVSLAANEQGESVVVLSFQSGSINFAQDRFLEIEISMEDEKGLKIPVSAIAQKEFFLVPEEFVLYVEEEDAYYIYVETYMEDGTRTIKNTEITPYSLKDGKYYLDDITLISGARILKADSQDSFVVSEKAALTGVYNMNKGYADFKQITVKKQNASYAIVESDTKYGLNVYDYIVLNASAVSADDFLYE